MDRRTLAACPPRHGSGGPLPRDRQASPGLFALIRALTIPSTPEFARLGSSDATSGKPGDACRGDLQQRQPNDGQKGKAMSETSGMNITVTQNGPYSVTGHVPLA
ncbi:MAG: hypothetical protein ACRDU0_11215, partial [Mycobacterium sp.]